MKETLLLELEQILKAVPTVNKVSHGKPEPITTETQFNAIYIMPEVSSFKNRTNKICKNGYWEIFPVSLLVNMECSSPLDWVKLESNIIDYVLNDKGIWTTIVDRELVTIGYDRFENFPKREFILQFEFKLV